MLELHYAMIQFLIISINGLSINYVWKTDLTRPQTMVQDNFSRLTHKSEQIVL